LGLDTIRGKRSYPSILQYRRDCPTPVCGATLVQFLQGNWLKLFIFALIVVAVIWAALPHGKSFKKRKPPSDEPSG
jgi:hypothetical protein